MMPRVLYFAGIDHPCLRTWVNHFRRMGHQVAVATFGQSVFSLWPEVPVLPYDSAAARLALRLSWSMGQAVRRRKLASIVAGFRPDVVHVHWLDAPAARLIELYDGPLVATPCGSDVLRYPAEDPELARCAAAVLGRADVVTCCSDAIRDAAVSLGATAQRCLELHWGIDPELFRAGRDTSALRRELGIEDRLVILSTRGSRPFYNLPSIVSAFAAAKDRLQRVSLVMLVDRPAARDELLAQARALGVADRVVVRPWTTQELVPLYYNLADVFVSVPSSEGLGSSLVESIACGAFPIASDIPANRQWLGSGGMGLIVPPGNVDALAEAMVRAIHEPALRARFKAENVRLAGDRADIEVNARRLGDIYRRLAGGQGGGHA